MNLCVISYIAEYEDAERRLRRGERQLYCSQCGGLWRWPDECSHEGRLTSAEFKRAVKESADYVRREYGHGMAGG